jgi:hypothetical protein
MFIPTFNHIIPAVDRVIAADGEHQLFDHWSVLSFPSKQSLLPPGDLAADNNRQSYQPTLIRLQRTDLASA